MFPLTSRSSGERENIVACDAARFVTGHLCMNHVSSREQAGKYDSYARILGPRAHSDYSAGKREFALGACATGMSSNDFAVISGVN